jgi:hypothetical protein
VKACFIFHGATAPSVPWRGPHLYRGFTINLRHTICGRTLLDEWWSAWCRGLYLTNTQHSQPSQQTFTSPAGFEPAILAVSGCRPMSSTVQTLRSKQTHIKWVKLCTVKFLRIKRATYMLITPKNFGKLFRLLRQENFVSRYILTGFHCTQLLKF